MAEPLSSWYVPQYRSLQGPPCETPHQTPQETWAAGFLETAAWRGAWWTRAGIKRCLMDKSRDSLSPKKWGTAGLPCLLKASRATNQASCEEDQALQSQPGFKWNSDYSGMHILTKEVQQVFENVLFKKLFASTTKFLGFLPKNGVLNAAAH